jgi:hypothetical protein
MLRWASITASLVLCCAVLAVAAERKPAATVAKPLGTWTKTEGEASITFRIATDNMQVLLKVGDDSKTTIDCDYGLSKDGHVFARMSKVTRQGLAEGPKEGDMFAFRFKVDKGKLVISDLTGSHASEDAKRIVEGEYSKVK